MISSTEANQRFSPLEVWGGSFSSVRIKVVQQSVKKTQSLMSLLKSIRILDKPQQKSARAECPSTGSLSPHLPFRPPARRAPLALGDTGTEPDKPDK